MRVVTVAYLGLTPDLPVPTAATAAARRGWARVADLRAAPLAFAHWRILADGFERVRSKIEYTPLATVFCPEEFTVAELRRVYDIMWGTTLDARNFHRKVTGAARFLEPTG